MVWSEWKVWEDEYGKYKSRTNEHGIEEKIVEHKQKYWDENPTVEPDTPQPTETELLMDYVINVDYRVTMIELGL